jgi:hypothetical protein
MIVHDVEVNPVRASRNHVFHFFAQTGKIGGKNTGGNNKRVHGAPSMKNS